MTVICFFNRINVYNIIDNKLHVHVCLSHIFVNYSYLCCIFSWKVKKEKSVKFYVHNNRNNKLHVLYMCVFLLGTVASSNGYRPDDYKPQHIGDLNCNGTEDSIFDCPYNNDTKSQGCSSRYHVSRLICQGILLPPIIIFILHIYI